MSDPAGGGYLLGVDAGNTKTVALIARRDGTVVGWGRSGCGDISSRTVGETAALANLAAAVERALAEAGVDPAALAGKAFSTAGADWPEDFEFLRAALARHPWGDEVVIVNDAVGALRAGSASGYGVAVVCGTYAVSAARTAGASWHAGFWQETGGAYGLARAALRAVFRADLGIDPPTALTGAVLDFFAADEVEGVLHRLTARRADVPDTEVARLAPLLLSIADGGDPIARRIVGDQGAVLAEYALAAARRVGIGDTFDLILTGGVFRHPSGLLREALVAGVRAAAPGARPLPARFEPAVGALLFAFEQARIPLDEALLARLAASSPAASLFAT